LFVHTPIIAEPERLAAHAHKLPVLVRGVASTNELMASQGKHQRSQNTPLRSAVMGDRRAIVAASKQPHPAARRLTYRISRPIVHEQLG
jgi:hypothetical protein